METELTVIIPFRNEGEEVENTIQSAIEFSTNVLKFILINDGSDDEYDYVKVAKKYNCIYHKHTISNGVAVSRDKGISLCETKYFILLDAHMRFYTKGWDEILLSYLKLNDNSLYCTQTKILNKENNLITEPTVSKTYGSLIDFTDEHLFKHRWAYATSTQYINKNLIEIPCVLGAGYATSKIFWNKIGGLNGLSGWGYDEEMISIKTWGIGGKCYLIDDIVIGHIYRKTAPYEYNFDKILYNKLYTIELLIPNELKMGLLLNLKHQVLPNVYNIIYDNIITNYHNIIKQRFRLDEQNYDFKRFMTINDSYFFLNKNYKK